MLGDKAKVSGEVAHPRSVGFVGGDAELGANFEQMPLIAAGCLADNQERPKAQFGVAPALGDEQLTDGFGLVCNGLAFVAGQDVDGEALLGDVEGDDVVE
jgi:hypothetical protein